MAPNAQCAAVAAAQAKTGLSYSDIASKIGSTPARITEICSGTSKPSEAEFKALAQVLGISDSIPHTGVHATS